MIAKESTLRGAAKECMRSKVLRSGSARLVSHDLFVTRLPLSQSTFVHCRAKVTLSASC